MLLPIPFNIPSCHVGRLFDEHGNYFNWWKDSSLKEFQKRTACLAKKYSKYSYYGLKVLDEILIMLSSMTMNYISI